MIPLRTLAACLLLSTAPALVACQTAAPTVSQQTATKAMIDADALYSAVATILNGVEQLAPAKASQAEAIKRAAYKALLDARTAYKLGKAIDLTALQGFLAQANALKGAA